MTANGDPDPDVIVAGSRLSVVHEFKYLGIIIDSQHTSITQVRKVVNRMKFMSCFSHT